MWPTIVWDLNVTTLAVFGAGCLTFYLGVMRMRDKLRDLSQATEAQVIAMTAIKLAHEALKENVQLNYVRKREDFDPVVERLFDRIDEQAREVRDALAEMNGHLLRIAGSPPKRG